PQIYNQSLHDALPIYRKARVSYKVQRPINASLNAATSTRAVSSNPNFVTRQKIEIMSQVTEQSVRFQTALASIKLIQAKAVWKQIGRAVQQECRDRSR